jgi:D-alanyl-lipoteichoic acid acyltransferase DltB (MBOAT superfamily)
VSQFSAFDYFANFFVLCLVVVPVYYLLPWAWARRTVLTLTGVYLVFLVAPRLALFYIAFWIAVAILQRLVAATGERKGGGYVLAVSILATLSLLVIWKLSPAHFTNWFNVYFNSGVFHVSAYLGSIDAFHAIILPIGLSFATFRAIDLLIQSYLGTVEGLAPGRVLFYGFFPSVQMIGPIIEYSEVGAQSSKVARFALDDYRAALAQVLVGAVKVFLLSVPLAASGDIFVVYRSNGPLRLWFELVVYAWFFYLNFSGYSDLAIGTARLFGYKLKPNFNRPYTRENPQSFWNSWHMSLTRFAQRNVFVPLGGFRQRSQYLALAATMMVIALWHDISVPLVIFGVYHTCGLIGARLLNQHRQVRIRPSWQLSVGKAILLFVYVTASLPLLTLKLDQIGPFYRALVGSR